MAVLLGTLLWPSTALADDGPSAPVQTALGIGAGGLALAGMAGGLGVEEPSTGVYVVGGIGLGTALVGFSTAGLLALWPVTEGPLSVAAAPGGAALAFEF